MPIEAPVIVVPPEPPNFTELTEPKFVPVTVIVAPLYVCVDELAGNDEVTPVIAGTAAKAELLPTTNGVPLIVEVILAAEAV